MAVVEGEGMPRGRHQRPGLAGAAAAMAILLPADAQAHASEGSLVLLLPTGHYIIGGTAAVALSVAVLGFVAPARVAAFHARRIRLPALPDPTWLTTAVALASALVFAFMVAAGFLGSRDPVLNPLPSFVWTVFWTGLFLLHGVVGNVWSVLNPWSGPLFLLRRFGRRDIGLKPLGTLPASIGSLPAILQLAAFGWFELVDLAPEDPRRLAMATAGYWVFNLAAMIVFGEAAWRQRGEPFGILFRLIGHLAPLGFEREGERIRPVLAWPCGRVYDLPAQPLSTVAFVLLAFAIVTFDGLSLTFVWLTSVGINPLEFPGRSAVVASSTAGILLSFLVFLASFLGAIGLGCRLAERSDWRHLAGRLIVSILPIAFGFQFAHYLTLALVGFQDFGVAMHAPFGDTGFRLGGPPGPVTLSFLNDYETVATIFAAQTGAITVGHLLAVLLAHGLPGPDRRSARLDLPFALLMILYTAFGLWLLSTPRI